MGRNPMFTTSGYGGANALPSFLLNFVTREVLVAWNVSSWDTINIMLDGKFVIQMESTTSLEILFSMNQLLAIWARGSLPLP